MTRLTTNLTIVALGFALLASPATSHACKGGRRARYAPPQVYYAPPQYQRPCPPRVVQAPPPASQAIGQFPTQGLVPQNGIQIPGTQVRIVDEAGAECAADEVGELFSMSPYLFNGYWQRPEETEEAFHDGVVVAVAGIAHGAVDAILGQFVAEIVA